MSPDSKFQIQNYISTQNTLTELNDSEQTMVLDRSKDLNVTINILAGLYVFLLCLIFILLIYIKREFLIKENKIIDFLPFFNVKLLQKRQ
jgi:hypothetical protein